MGEFLAIYNVVNVMAENKSKLLMADDRMKRLDVIDHDHLNLIRYISQGNGVKVTNIGRFQG